MTVHASGFASAVQPVTAQTMITTDTNGLTAGEIRFAASDGEMPAYRALPQGGKNIPLVLVVQEIFGVHEHIKDVCRRLAKAGYFAVAPELYARQGDVSKLTDIDAVRGIVDKVPDTQVMTDLDAAAAWAIKNGANDAKMAITGFCWGGRQTWLYAAHNRGLRAAVAWYGGLVRAATPTTPRHPIDIAATLKVPVLGLYGGADSGIPVDTVEKMRAALKVAGSESELVVYPDTPHAFYADYRPSYRREAAEDGWKRMLAWFKKYGIA